MLDDDLLGFRRVDVHTAGDDHVAEAVGDVDETVFVDVADLTEGEDPRAQVRLGRLLGVVRVDDSAAGRVFEEQPSFGVGRKFVAVIVDDDAAGERRVHDLAHRTGVGQPILTRDRTHGADLGRAVCIDEHRTEPFDHALLHVDGALRPRVRQHLHRRDVVLVPHVGGQVEHALEVRRHHHAACRLRLLDRSERALGVELLENDDGRSGREDAHARQGTRVVHRTDDEVHTERCETVGREHSDVFGNVLAAREHRRRQVDTLREAGRAAGVEHVGTRGHVVGGLGIARPGKQRLERLDAGRKRAVGAPHDDRNRLRQLCDRVDRPRQVLGTGEQKPGARVVQDVGGFFGVQMEVHRHAAQPRVQRTHVGERGLNAVFGVDGDAPVGSEIARLQVVDETVDRRVQFTPRERFRRVADRDVVGLRLRGVGQYDGHGYFFETVAHTAGAASPAIAILMRSPTRNGVTPIVIAFCAPLATGTPRSWASHSAPIV